MRRNITLIGMAAAGKSSIGRALAKRLGYEFLDIDKMIEKNTKLRLQQIIDNFGDKGFMEIEQEAVLRLGLVENCVISPGGSVIYSRDAMRFLKRISRIVFLNVSYEGIQKRLTNRDTRGIVGLKKKSLKALFDERLTLYKSYADVTVEVPEDFDMEPTIKTIVQELAKSNN